MACEECDFDYSIGYQDGLLEGSARFEAIMESILANRYGNLSAADALAKIGAACGYHPSGSPEGPDTWRLN
jgi:hypothetical protein